jgi:hypothetical protein
MDNFLPENITKINCTYQQEEEILSVQETDAKLKPEHKGFLCPETHMNTNMMIMMIILDLSTRLPSVNQTFEN